MRVLLTGAAIAALFVGCGESDGGEAPREPDAPATTDSSPSKALSQMEVAFEGNPSQAAIRADLDKAFRLYGVPITEQNYSRAGSSLVALRKENGVPEMRILRQAIRLHVPDVAIELPQAFGLAAADLATR